MDNLIKNGSAIYKQTTGSKYNLGITQCWRCGLPTMGQPCWNCGFYPMGDKYKWTQTFGGLKRFIQLTRNFRNTGEWFIHGMTKSVKFNKDKAYAEKVLSALDRTCDLTWPTFSDVYAWIPKASEFYLWDGMHPLEMPHWGRAREECIGQILEESRGIEERAGLP